MKTLTELRVLVAGSQSLINYGLVKSKLDHYLKNKASAKIIIISGGAKGADKLGEQYAKQKGYDIEQYLPNWEKYGKSAGFKRNVDMVEVADVVVAFWDGNSAGTRHTIELTKKSNKPLRIVRFKKICI